MRFDTVSFIHKSRVKTALNRSIFDNSYRQNLEGPQRVHISAKWLMHCGRDTHCWRLDWVCPYSFEWAEWRIVRREMYLTCVWKVDNISIWTRYCWKRRFIGLL